MVTRLKALLVLMLIQVMFLASPLFAKSSGWIAKEFKQCRLAAEREHDDCRDQAGSLDDEEERQEEMRVCDLEHFVAETLCLTDRDSRILVKVAEATLAVTDEHDKYREELADELADLDSDDNDFSSALNVAMSPNIKDDFLACTYEYGDAPLFDEAMAGVDYCDPLCATLQYVLCLNLAEDEPATEACTLIFSDHAGDCRARSTELTKRVTSQTQRTKSKRSLINTNLR